jgi:hypothetical protein
MNDETETVMTSHHGNVHRVRLTAHERELLLTRFTLSSTLHAALEHAKADASDVCIEYEEAESLRDQAGDLFQEVGLDASMTATPQGKLLDSLIDKLLVERTA